MPKVKRNDPCPCGSGRKYKQCCGPKDRAEQVRGVTLRRDDELLWASLVAFARRPAFSGELQASFSRFWNGHYDLDAAEGMSRQDLLPFLEWHVYDYRTSKDRQRFVDLYATEEGPRMGPELRGLLAERQAAHLSLLAIEAVEPGGRLEVGDLLEGGFHTVEDAGLARLAMPGDLLLGRRFGEAADGRLSPGTALLPGTLATGLVAAAKAAYTAYRDEHYEATWGEFLREAGYVLFHHLQTPEAAEAYGRAVRRQGYYDPRPAIEAMQAVMRRLAEEKAQKLAEEEEERRRKEAEKDEPRPLVERTAGGVLVPAQAKPVPDAGRKILLPEDWRR